jgi:AraC-like DNA-binding protein
VGFIQRGPSPALAPFVKRVGLGEGLMGWRELVVPTGAMTLVVNLGEGELRWYDGDDRACVHASRAAMVLGASADPVSWESAGRSAVAFVSFWPGRACPFFGVPGPAAGEPLAELEALWGRDGALLRERMLEATTAEAMLSTMEAVLLYRAARSPVPDPAVVAAATMLGRGATVAEAADRVGWTDRTLRRRFTEQAGLTPKRFARVRRLQRLIARIPDGRQADWARVAAECGYFDQAHLSNEFRALTGLTPGAYRPLPCGNHHLPPRRSVSSNPRHPAQCEKFR